MSVHQRTMTRSIRTLRMQSRVAYSNSHHRYERKPDSTRKGLNVDFGIIHIDVIIIPQYIADPFRRSHPYRQRSTKREEWFHTRMCRNMEHGEGVGLHDVRHAHM
jgi:hypothetical protein